MRVIYWKYLKCRFEEFETKEIYSGAFCLVHSAGDNDEVVATSSSVNKCNLFLRAIPTGEDEYIINRPLLILKKRRKESTSIAYSGTHCSLASADNRGVINIFTQTSSYSVPSGPPRLKDSIFPSLKIFLSSFPSSYFISKRWKGEFLTRPTGRGRIPPIFNSQDFPPVKYRLVPVKAGFRSPTRG